MLNQEWKEIVDNALDEWKGSLELYHNISEVKDAITERIRDEGFKLNLKHLEAIDKYIDELYQLTSEGIGVMSEGRPHG